MGMTGQGDRLSDFQPQQAQMLDRFGLRLVLGHVVGIPSRGTGATIAFEEWPCCVVCR